LREKLSGVALALPKGERGAGLLKNNADITTIVHSTKYYKTKKSFVPQLPSKLFCTLTAF